MPNAPTKDDLYLDRIFWLEHSYNEERDRADAAERRAQKLRNALEAAAHSLERAQIFIHRSANGFVLGGEMANAALEIDRAAAEARAILFD